MISILQAIVLIFVLFVLSRVIIKFRQGKINTYEMIFWSIVWVAVAIVLFIPQITNPIAEFLNIGRGIDVAVYLSIVLLFYLVFRLYVKVDALNHNLTKVVRETAVKKRDRKK